VGDIEARGRLEPITLHPDGRVLDGRNRVLALQRLGRPIKAVTYHGADPKAFVESVNFHRRHLTTETKRERAARMLRDNPQHSNRAIAKIADLDDKTVAAERAGLESTAETPQTYKRTGRDGRTRRQPVTKPRTPSRPVAYVPPPPEPQAPVRNQPIISGDVDLTCSNPAEAIIPDQQPNNIGGPIGGFAPRPRIFSIPRDPLEMGAFLFNEIGAHDCRKLVDAILALLRPEELCSDG
jgi:hypothetical protein